MNHQFQSRGPQHHLIYAPQCPNCTRFVKALERTPVNAYVARTDVNSLTPAQRQGVTAVPTLVLGNGQVLVGSAAFSWLKQYERDVEVESFALGRGLAFSDFESLDGGLASFAEPFSAFEPVP